MDRSNRLFHCLNTTLKVGVGIDIKISVTFCCRSSAVSNEFPFNITFGYSQSEKSAGAKSGLDGTARRGYLLEFHDRLNKVWHCPNEKWPYSGFGLGIWACFFFKLSRTISTKKDRSNISPGGIDMDSLQS
jgi:hypothetical protein